MSVVSRMLLIIFVVLLPLLFAALIWAVAFHFNPPNRRATDGGPDFHIALMR